MTSLCEQYTPGPAARVAARLGGRLPVLDTRRLQIRGPRVYDFDAYAGILCSDRAQHMGGPMSRAAAWADFTSHTACWLLHGHGLWTIDASTTPSAGFVRLGFDYDIPKPELDIFLTAGAEGHGYAEEALCAARTHAFDTLGWNSVISCVASENTRGIALMARVGAHCDGAADDGLTPGDALIFRHVKQVPA
jgi:RimJ/RimL family protein N-acetyltransferase